MNCRNFFAQLLGGGRVLPFVQHFLISGDLLMGMLQFVQDYLAHMIYYRLYLPGSHSLDAPLDARVGIRHNHNKAVTAQACIYSPYLLTIFTYIQTDNPGVLPALRDSPNAIANRKEGWNIWVKVCHYGSPALQFYYSQQLPSRSAITFGWHCCSARCACSTSAGASSSKPG